MQGGAIPTTIKGGDPREQGNWYEVKKSQLRVWS